MGELYADPRTGWLLPVHGGIVTQGYGPENTDPSVRHLYRKGYHTGIDVAGVPEGTAVVSPVDATVESAGPNDGYGQCVVLDRGDTVTIVFGHLCRIAVQPGERVALGQELGGIGSTGVSTGVHLHYEYRRNGVDIDPTPFLVRTLPDGQRATVTEALQLREGPSKDTRSLGIAPVGTVVTIGRDGWYPVWWEGREGWMFGRYLRLETAGAEAPPARRRRTGRTTASPNLRAGPGMDYGVLAVLKPGTAFEVLAEQGEWLQVTAEGRDGFVHRSFVRLDDQSPPGRIGRVTAHPNLRSGPGPEHAVLRVLEPGTVVTLVEAAEQHGYLYVRVGDAEGFVHRDFVLCEDQGVPDGFLRGRLDLTGIPMSPPRDRQITLAATAGDTERLAGETWNRYGGLLASVCDELRIDRAAAVAVLAIESGGRGFGASGRMIIRFENHIFYDAWGKSHVDTFGQHFRFNAERCWLNHQWRPVPDQPWGEFHGDQTGEWQVFEFACGLDDTAAKQSISMGAPQIMGFNCTAIGYESVQEMYDAFSASEAAQIIGLFDFVQGVSSSSPRMLALQGQDFVTFAALYNGSGQAAEYASRMRGVSDSFHRLQG